MRMSVKRTAATLCIMFGLTLALYAQSSEPEAKKRQITYTLASGSEKWDPAILKRITDSMDSAVALYNSEGEFNKKITVNYSPRVKTADGNINGRINFGHMISKGVAMHEIAHTLGIGTHWKWRRFAKHGLWTGEHAIAQLQEFCGPNAKLHADRMHFWPYGLNYPKECNPESEARHVKMVAAFRKDLGIDK